MQRGIVECRKKYPTKKTELRLPAAVQPFKSFNLFIFRCFNIRFQYLDLDQSVAVECMTLDIKYLVVDFNRCENKLMNISDSTDMTLCID